MLFKNVLGSSAGMEENEVDATLTMRFISEKDLDPKLPGLFS
jgi:hypothetical protein